VAHAYTPGLKVLERTSVRKARLLPLRGRVLAAEGARVRAADVVAEAELPGEVHPVNVAGLLGVRPEEIAHYMLKGPGDHVEKGELLAQTRPWIKWLKASCQAPVGGTIESASQVTGQVMLREPPQNISLSAYVSGTVEQVMPEEGVVVRAEGALVQGIFGLGGECTGRLKVVASGPEAAVGPEALDSSCGNCIIVVGAQAGVELLRAAAELGVAAVVAAAMPAEQLRELLGYDIGVAVTGSEQIGTTVVLTEGFGAMPMARRTFELLEGLQGREASACGATQIRAGVLRPEVIVPAREGEAQAPIAGAAAPVATADGLHPGARVRVIRRPRFGMIGRVTELVAEPVRIETEALVRALKVELEDGQTLTVPRANVEIIET